MAVLCSYNEHQSILSKMIFSPLFYETVSVGKKSKKINCVVSFTSSLFNLSITNLKDFLHSCTSEVGSILYTIIYNIVYSIYICILYIQQNFKSIFILYLIYIFSVYIVYCRNCIQHTLSVSFPKKSE